MKTVDDALLFNLEARGLSRLVCLADMGKQIGMVARFDPQNEAQVMPL